jgi:hypothetical protein
MTDTDYIARVRVLNDQLRQQGRGGRVLISAGVAHLAAHEQLELIRAVRAFKAFTPDNDPYGEHDCATVKLPNHGRFIWKIDYYDLALTGHSPDPSDSAVTARVLTLMSAEEY